MYDPPQLEGSVVVVQILCILFEQNKKSLKGNILFKMSKFHFANVSLSIFKWPFILTRRAGLHLFTIMLSNTQKAQHKY